MVSNSLYKSYCNQIAKLFCVENSNKVLCEASLSSRLIQYLDDATFPYFLAKLESGRQYITNVEQLQNKGFRIVVTDLITGLRQTAWWDHAWNLPYLSKIPSIMLSHQFNIISANKTFDNENWSDFRITHNPIKKNYGITFIPNTPPGYVPPGGGGGYVPPGGGGTIIKTPPTQIPATAASGFNFEEILNNPIILIGAGLLAIYFIMKK